MHALLNRIAVLARGLLVVVGCWLASMAWGQPNAGRIDIGPMNPAWGWSAQGSATLIKAADVLWIRLDTLTIRNHQSDQAVFITHVAFAAGEWQGKVPTTYLRSLAIPINRSLGPGEAMDVGPLAPVWMPWPNWHQSKPLYSLEVYARDSAGQEGRTWVPTTMGALGIPSVLGTEWHARPSASHSWVVVLVIVSAVVGWALLGWLVAQSNLRRKFVVWVALSPLWFGGGFPLISALPTIGWEPVDATVLDASVLTTSTRVPSAHSVAVQYLYTYDKALHVGTRWSFLLEPNFGTHEQADAEAQRLLALRRSAQPVTVWVNPMDPSQAVMERVPSVWAGVLGAVFCVAVLVLGWRMRRR